MAGVSLRLTHEVLAHRLTTLGFLAADDEAEELLSRANGDVALLEELVNRRLTGEPLSWVTGSISFCGVHVKVHPGVYEPRSQSQALAERAIARLPDDGIAIDLCTGTGAIAVAMRARRPRATVVATELESRAFNCARENGVDVYQGDLFGPLPRDLAARVDVVVGVVPYVPTAALPLLPRDTFDFESELAYDGGPAGTDLLSRVMAEAPRFLRPGGALLLELGGDQDADLAADLELLRYVGTTFLYDEEGDVRGLEARRPEATTG